MKWQDGCAACNCAASPARRIERRSILYYRRKEIRPRMSIPPYTFFQNAPLGSLLASILCGLIGTYIVARRLVFISGGITHASFGGIGIGVYPRFSPYSLQPCFCLVSLRHTMVQPPPRHARRFGHRHFLDFRHEHRHHLQFFGTGLHPELSSYLFGNILTVTPSDLYLLGHIGTHRHGCFTFFFSVRSFPLLSTLNSPVRNVFPATMVEYLMMASSH